MSRLEILEASLSKKQADFDKRLADHFADVRSANGQPLNDKRCGAATMGRWDRQNDTLRNLRESIEKTTAAIEKERDKCLNVASEVIPEVLRSMAEAGELNQWRKHPRMFFVPGVERGRIVWDSTTGIISPWYTREIPKEQYPKFRDTFNKAASALRTKGTT